MIKCGKHMNLGQGKNGIDREYPSCWHAETPSKLFQSSEHTVLHMPSFWTWSTELRPLKRTNKTYRNQVTWYYMHGLNCKQGATIQSHISKQSCFVSFKPELLLPWRWLIFNLLSLIWQPTVISFTGLDKGMLLISFWDKSEQCNLTHDDDFMITH